MRRATYPVDRINFVMMCDSISWYGENLSFPPLEISSWPF